MDAEAGSFREEAEEWDGLLDGVLEREDLLEREADLPRDGAATNSLFLFFLPLGFFLGSLGGASDSAGTGIGTSSFLALSTEALAAGLGLFLDIR